MNWELDYIQEDPNSIASPPGLTTTSNKQVIPIKKDLKAWRRQKAWDLAISPAKNVPMQGFMMWMSGTTVQIFSVMGVWFLLKGAITAILNYQAPFEQFDIPVKEGESKETYQLQKLVFIICQFGLLAVGIWKVNAMGILPTRTSDYLELMKESVEWQGNLKGIRIVV